MVLPPRGGPHFHSAAPLLCPLPLLPLSLAQVFPKPDPFLFFSSTQLTQVPFQEELSWKWKSIKKENYRLSDSHGPNLCSCHD